MKIIIWGYPTHTHTYSYINQGFYNAFTHLGYDTHWFSDGDHPDTFDFDNCIFLTEGRCDVNIPLNNTSIYVVHTMIDPLRYVEGGVKRLIDMRYNTVWHDDGVYDYTMDKSKLTKVGKSCYFEESTGQTIRFENEYDGHSYDVVDYDKFYVTWATDKLPFEIDVDDVYRTRDYEINFCGTMTHGGRWENQSVFAPFKQRCAELNIPFNHNCPWNSPIDRDDMVNLVQRSLIGIDLRGPEHLKNGYVPCRVMKNISYGHLGLTNSMEVFRELDGNCHYNSDPVELLDDGLRLKGNHREIQDAMRYIRDHHTYVNRVESLMKIIN